MTPKEKATEIKSDFMKKISETFIVATNCAIPISFAELLAIEHSIIAVELVQEQIKFDIGNYAEENKLFWIDVKTELIKQK